MEKLRLNIEETIGDVPYEIIAIDNRKEPESIASAYNRGAAKAKYPYLLFIHEDAGFVDKNWAEEITNKLSEQDCGVIGFAGSQLMLNAPGGWNVMPQWCVWNIIEAGNHNMINIDGSTLPFKEVVALDGFAMFVRKDVWQKHHFDTTVLRGFHCYDVDFSLSIGIEYKNYVCTDIMLYHDSKGNFGKVWVQETQRVYKEKWKNILPRFTPEVTLSTKEKVRFEERVYWRFIRAMAKYGIHDSDISRHFCQYPLTFRHLRHLFRAKFSIKDKIQL